MKMTYYKYRWDESRGDQFEDWGKSWLLIEVANDNYLNRQIEIYDNGKILKYSREKLTDEFGGLGDQKFNLNEFHGEECSSLEFESQWNQ